jgi:radical SAM superfamily enzyme YgiQ (UPF0313 family)
LIQPDNTPATLVFNAGIMKNALLIYPEYPVTFWGFKYALKFIHCKAAYPPLGLLTVASMLPADWDVKLVDLNVEILQDKLLSWADYVLISAMNVQRKSTKEVIHRCKKHGKKIIASGPLFTSDFSEFQDVDYLVLNEAELTLPGFLLDLANGTPKHIYSTNAFADISVTPVPMWSLIDMNNYATMNIQYSRGCPYDCEFCDITLLFGRKVRTKSSEQVIRELEAVHKAGWHNEIFFVDDNFIGNKPKLKNDILPAIAAWQSRFRIAHSFNTQVSIELADDPELIKLMTGAGFDKVFVGIETPHEESLKECNKYKNENRNLISSVNALQNGGLEVAGGFIVGFDNDPSSIFDTQVKFIQRSGIVTAMVGLLTALPETKLYHRLHQENRILKQSTGDNTDFSLNFIPRMKTEELMMGYQKLLTTIYSPKEFYARIKIFLKEYNQTRRKRKPMSFFYMLAFIKSVIFIGFWNKSGFRFWNLLIWTLFNRPWLIKNSITFTIYGFHFRKILKLNIERMRLAQGR